MFESESTCIYRAERKSDGMPVTLKTYKDAEDTYKIRHEYDILKPNHIKSVSNVIDIFQTDDNQTYLVSEDNDAVVLEDYIKSKEFDESEFLRLFENSCESLSLIHAAHIIHRDIKPANMLIEPKSLQVWFIDFGISLLKKNGAEQRQESIVGTLEYISPEQTGRINKPLDQRSDIYSLGVTMYRILTGVLPFTGKTTTELIHGHVAVRPTPPKDVKNVSEHISDVIMKMIEKTPENRYQTAYSIIYDINRIKSFPASGTGEKAPRFRVGENDIFSSLESNGKLYCKDSDFKIMKDAFDEIDDSKATLLLLEGPEASGKSFLLDAFERYVRSKFCLIFRGTNDNDGNAEPFHMFRDAFTGLEAQLHNAKLSFSAFRGQLLDFLGDNVNLLAQILPSLRNALNLPSVNSNDPSYERLSDVMENKFRLEQTFGSFIQVLCNLPYPCVFIFDNMQLSDRACLRLIFAAINSSELCNCLFLISYRSTDYRNADALAGSVLNEHLNGLNYNRAKLLKLSLTPPTTAEASDIIMDAFPMERRLATELARHIISHTEGQIRDIAVYLKALYRTKSIVFDEKQNNWVLDHDLDENPNFAEGPDITHIYAALSDEAKSVLHLLLCVGAYMSRETLEIIFEGSEKADDALTLATPFIDVDWFDWNSRLNQYAFSSGRLLSTLYENIPPDVKRQCHRLIGKRIYAHYNADSDALIAHCSTITEHFNKAGVNPKENLDDMLDLLRLNMLSGAKATHVSNFDKAKRHYETAHKICQDISAAGHGDKITVSDLRGLRKNLASCMFALGEREEALKIYEELITSAEDERERDSLFSGMIRQQMAAAEWAKIVDSIKAYLEGSGLLESDDADPALLGELEFIKYTHYVESHDVSTLMNKRISENPVVLRNGSLLATLATNALMSSNSFAYYYIYKTINYAFEHGGFPWLERAIALAAEKNAANRDYFRAQRAFDLGLAYSERNKLSQSTLWAAYSASIAHWTIPFSELPAVHQKSRQIAKMEGNPYYASFVDAIILSFNLFQGTRLSRVSRDADAASYTAGKHFLNDFKYIFDVCFRQFIRCLSGATNGLDSFDDRSFNESEFIASQGEVSWNFISIYYYPHRMQALFIHGYYQKVLDYASEMKLNYVDQELRKGFIQRFYIQFYQSMSIIKLCETDSGFLGKYLPLLYANMDILKGHAEANAGNFAPFYKLVDLEVHKLSGLRLAYISEYSLLSQQFKDMGFCYERCIIEESLAHLWSLNYEVEQYKSIQFQRTLELYRAIGAKAKVKMLSENLPENPYLSEHLSEDSLTHTTYTSTSAIASSSMDFQAILDLIGIMVSGHGMEDMVEHMLDLMIKHSFAEQALLLLNIDEELKLYNFKFTNEQRQELSYADLPISLTSIEPSAMPLRIIGYVAEKKVVAVANAADNEFGFLNDPYLTAKQPESFICLPVITNSSLLGIIYLENARLPGIFPPSRVKFLTAAAAQSGLLLQNALEVQRVTSYNIDLEKRLSSYTKQLNTLISGIAHEINTPLGVCVTLATGLQAKTEETMDSFAKQSLSKAGLNDYFQESHEGLEILMGNITRTTNLVQNFKKITVNQTAGVFDFIDLMPELGNIVDYVRPAIKNIVGSCTIQGPDTLKIYSSTGALAQIFTNMIMNSAIHAFVGMPKADCKIEIHIMDLEDSVSITYQDNGRGMTAEERDQFFIPFFTMRRSEGGSGLGGHIILSLVTQTLGGTIQIVSSPGQGCRFNMNLPKLSESAHDGGITQAQEIS
ncbi:MAG: protein kinase [Clostridiales Family XIII bacterium]|nr:protein kinase [Clostridiales Family XIII bacterium]